MGIALILNLSKAEEWQVEINTYLPKVKVEIFPDIENYSEIEFALCWKPEADYYTYFPK